MLEKQRLFAESENRFALVKRNQSRIEDSESTVFQVDPGQPVLKMVKKEYLENVETPTPPYYLLLKDKLGVYLLTVYTPLRISKRVTVTPLADSFDEWGFGDSLSIDDPVWTIKSKYGTTSETPITLVRRYSTLKSRRDLEKEAEDKMEKEDPSELDKELEGKHGMSYNVLDKYEVEVSMYTTSVERPM